MILLPWVRGKLLRRFASMAGPATGVALTVALVLTLGIFLTVAESSMTSRATSAVPIDWQIQAVSGASIDDVASVITATDGVVAVHEVQYLDTAGFEARTGETTQRTGPGQIVSIDDAYLKDFAAELRVLSGDAGGILIAQQTAANLHVGPGGTVTIERTGLPPVNVVVSAVVDLPDADAFFQAVGLSPDAAPQAPPDNVLVFSALEWRRLFLPEGSAVPVGARSQWHIRLRRDALPNDPVSAYTFVRAAARNVEARLAGRGLLADNLGARLDAVREDALYASVLFLFLGMPGMALAAASSFAVVLSGATRRRKEQALLRVRGASPPRIAALSVAEGAVIAAGGTAAGVLLAALLAHVAPGLEAPGKHPRELLIATAVGAIVAVASFVHPALRDARSTTVSRSRLTIGKSAIPLWKRFWLDVALLVIAALLLWQSASTGYQIVLAAEGVAATSVDYKAFIAPALAWVGITLLMARLSGHLLSRNSWLLRTLVAPLSGRLAPVVTAALSRQSRTLSAGLVASAIAIAFATSTAVFNATFNAQARLDAQLTNGSDVTVFGTLQKPAGSYLAALSALPDVVAAEPMQHRFAYVGTDLQDLYGIDPLRIGRATNLSDAFFSGHNAARTLQQLATIPNGVLVSEETVQDFQLQEGDEIKLRLMNASDHQYHPVSFVFVGVAREFPTAPKDSFLVANASYVAESTGAHQAEYVLVHSVSDPRALARRIRSEVITDPAIKVSDISEATQIIGSSLTSVDLRGLTTIELGFSIATTAGAAGLMLALGISERRRSFAILSAIGAKRWQLACFLWSEGLVTLLGGTVFGLFWGFAAAWMLVKLLTGIFDPPPEVLSIPWGYLATVLCCVAASIVAAIVLVLPTLKFDASHLRDL
jgi:putative ABC transport system permease protein